MGKLDAAAACLGGGGLSAGIGSGGGLATAEAGAVVVRALGDGGASALDLGKLVAAAACLGGGGADAGLAGIGSGGGLLL